MSENTTNSIESDVLSLITTYKELEQTEQELSSQNEMFAKFIQAQKKFKSESEMVWGIVKDQMVANNIKSIKGDWGTITLTSRDTYQADEDKLPNEYFKIAPDLKKIGDDYKLTGILPSGVTKKTSTYIAKRLKGIEL